MTQHLHIKQCPITESEESIRYFSLGNQPLANNLADSREQSLAAEQFPLNLNYYPKSNLTMLDFSVDGSLLFSHYFYKTGAHAVYAEHCKGMFKTISNYVIVSDGTRFIDIGGNDGTLLLTFKSLTDKNISVLNVDPSKNLTKISVENGIPAINDFFSLNVLSEHKNTVDVITSTNVFQHLLDIDSFVHSVSQLLSDNGIWLLEFPYWLHSMLTNQFDQIYHEHVYYYLVTPLNILFKKHNLKIINVSKQNIHGGSLRLVIAKNNSKHTTDQTLDEYLTMESKFDKNFYTTWGSTIDNHILQSKYLLNKIKSEDKTIYGFGAAAKGCVFLNALGADYNIIDVVIDDTDIKQNKFIPGTGIQIVSRDILTKTQPDYILILAHNFADYIIKSLSSVYTGKFIVLLPEIKII